MAISARQFLATAAIILVCAGFVSAGPHVVLGKDPAGDDIRAAASGLLNAMISPKPDLAREYFAGDETQTAILESHLRWIKNSRVAIKLLVDRFGDQPDWIGIDGEKVVQGRIIALPQVPLIFNGDAASICGTSALDYGLNLKRIDGRWKVTHFAPGRTHESHTQKFAQGMADACDAIVADINSGKIATAAHAKDRFNQDAKTLIEFILPPQQKYAVPKLAPNTMLPDASELKSMIGKSFLSPEMANLIARLSGLPRLSISREHFFLYSDNDGVDLWFSTTERAPMQNAMLFADGIEGHSAYTGKLNLGLTMADRRADVERKIGAPPESSGWKRSYRANYPLLGISVRYTGKDGRDGDATIEDLGISAPELEPDAALATSPRVAFRFEDADLGVAADVLPDPFDPAVKIRIAKKAVLDESDIENAFVMMGDPPGDPPRLGMTLTPDGATKMKQLTAANIGRRMAIVFDGLVLTAPVIRTEIAQHLTIEFAAGTDPKTVRRHAGRMHAAINTLRPTTQP